MKKDAINLVDHETKHRYVIKIDGNIFFATIRRLYTDGSVISCIEKTDSENDIWKQDKEVFNKAIQLLIKIGAYL